MQAFSKIIAVLILVAAAIAAILGVLGVSGGAVGEDHLTSLAAIIASPIMAALATIVWNVATLATPRPKV